MSVVATTLTISGAGLAVVDKFTVDTSFKDLEWRPFQLLVQLPINILTSETQTWDQLHTSVVESVRNSITEMSVITS